MSLLRDRTTIKNAIVGKETNVYFSRTCKKAIFPGKGHEPNLLGMPFSNHQIHHLPSITQTKLGNDGNRPVRARNGLGFN